MHASEILAYLSSDWTPQIEIQRKAYPACSPGSVLVALRRAKKYGAAELRCVPSVQGGMRPEWRLCDAARGRSWEDIRGVRMAGESGLAMPVTVPDASRLTGLPATAIRRHVRHGHVRHGRAGGVLVVEREDVCRLAGR